MFETEQNKNGTKLYTFEDKKPDLHQMQALVGGYIEVIHCMGYDLVVNEEGRMLGYPKNEKATELYHKIPIHSGDIVGNAVVLFGNARLR